MSPVGDRVWRSHITTNKQDQMSNETTTREKTHYLQTGFPADDRRSVRDKLCLLGDEGLLPEAPNKILGSEIIEIIHRMPGEPFAVDATIRYHLSILSQNPATPFAKVAEGQGYFLRPRKKRTFEDYFWEVGRLSDALDVSLALIANLLGRTSDQSLVEIQMERATLMKQLSEFDEDRWISTIEAKHTA